MLLGPPYLSSSVGIGTLRGLRRAGCRGFTGPVPPPLSIRGFNFLQYTHIPRTMSRPLDSFSPLLYTVFVLKMILIFIFADPIRKGVWLWHI